MESPTDTVRDANKLRILYLGVNYGTSAQRAQALIRLGHLVDILDPWASLVSGGLTRTVLGKMVYEGYASFLEPYARQRFLRAIGGRSYDLIWVDHGELIGPSTLVRLKEVAPLVVNYIIDDPFCKMYRKRLSLYRKGIAFYDLIAVARIENVSESYAAGARNVLRVFMSADELAHSPIEMKPEEKAKWASEVAFIGTWMPERGPFLARLLQLGVPLAIYGDRWRNAKEWPVLKSSWAGAGLQGEGYVKAIQCAKICLGLLSKGPRDMHTTRSVEIPYIGSVLCAERTLEHEAMYEEGREAVFWGTPEECAEKIFWLLENPEARVRIAKAGRERCIKNAFLNEAVMKKILDAACEAS